MPCRLSWEDFPELCDPKEFELLELFSKLPSDMLWIRVSVSDRLSLLHSLSLLLSNLVVVSGKTYLGSSEICP